MWKGVMVSVSAAVLVLYGSSQAQVEEAIATVVTIVPGPGEGSDSAIYTHSDCIDPADNVHVHTESASGFRFNGKDIFFTVSPMPASVDGEPCPVPVFTGAYNLSSVCGAGTSNQGNENLRVRYDFVGGVLKESSSSQRSPCTGPSGGLYTLNIKVDIRSATIGPNGLSAPPSGAVRLDVTQEQP